MMNRTQEEIVSRIEERKAGDFFGFEINEYLGFLEYEYVKPYIKEGTTEVDWKSGTFPSDPVEQIKNYMPFAWEKANNQRGISANRSVMHMIAWLWLAGEDELAEWASDDENYYHYGKPILMKICDHYKLDWEQWDDGRRTNGDEE